MHKPLKKILFLLFLIQILCFVFLLSPNTVNAGDSYTLKIPIGNFKSVDFKGNTRAIAEYIQAIYTYAIGVVAILATIVMMVGGIVWITAGGNQGRIGEAKQWITGALTGLVLALCSFMILQTVNPDLVSFKPVGIARVEKINCVWSAVGKKTTENSCEVLNKVEGSTCEGSKPDDTNNAAYKCCCDIKNNEIKQNLQCTKCETNITDKEKYIYSCLVEQVCSEKKEQGYYCEKYPNDKCSYSNLIFCPSGTNLFCTSNCCEYDNYTTGGAF